MCNLELHATTYVSLLNGYNSKLWLRKHNIIKVLFSANETIFRVKLFDYIYYQTLIFKSFESNKYNLNVKK